MERIQVRNKVHKMEIPCRDVNRWIDRSVVRYVRQYHHQSIHESINQSILFISHHAVYQ